MKLITLFPLLAASLTAMSAQAQLINYDFTAAIYSAWGANSPFHEGDLVQGKLTYDTIATPHYAGHADNPNYSIAVYNTDFKLRISFTASDFSYTTEENSRNHLEVISDATKVSFFSGEANKHIGITLLDFTEKPTVNAKIPTQIDLASYEYTNFAYGQYDEQFKPIIGFAARLKSLDYVSAVPEPDTRLLLVAGMFAIGIWSSKVTTRRKKITE